MAYYENTPYTLSKPLLYVASREVRELFREQREEECAAVLVRIFSRLTALEAYGLGLSARDRLAGSYRRQLGVRHSAPPSKSASSRVSWDYSSEHKWARIGVDAV